LFEIVKVQIIGVYFANEFNRMKPSSSSSMKLIPVSIVDLVSRNTYMTAAEVFPGEFEKFNNNDGFIKPGHPGNSLSFQHSP
jgi:hypothetical protein